MSYPTPPEATIYLHEHIPQSAAMEVAFRYLGVDKVELTAPLAPNINHRQTVFGGSISSVAILSAWAYLHFRLHTTFTIMSRVVISHSETAYTKPVEGDFVAVCHAPSPEIWNRFAAALTRHGKGRLLLSAHIYPDSDPDNPVALFTGTFVAVNQKPDAHD